MLQEQANALPGLDLADRAARVTVADTTVLVLTGEVAPREVTDCAGADVLILSVVDTLSRPCEVYDARRLRDTGALAGRVEAGALVLTTVRDTTGDRLWSPAP